MKVDKRQVSVCHQEMVMETILEIRRERMIKDSDRKSKRWMKTMDWHACANDGKNR